MELKIDFRKRKQRNLALTEQVEKKKKQYERMQKVIAQYSQMRAYQQGY